MRPEIVAIIPARGGSKSIPRKNIRLLGGKPLIGWTIELARSVPRISRVIVSTDDDEITTIARQYGAEMPFRRPSSLAQDETETLPVLQHCLQYLVEWERFRPDIVVLLYATAPLLRQTRVEEALDLFERTGCRSVVSVVRDSGRFWRSDGGRHVPFYPPVRLNRQYYEPLLRENGALYCSRYDVLITDGVMVDEKSVQFVVMEPDESIDIDTPHDFFLAEQQWQARRVCPP